MPRGNHCCLRVATRARERACIRVPDMSCVQGCLRGASEGRHKCRVAPAALPACEVSRALRTLSPSPFTHTIPFPFDHLPIHVRGMGAESLLGRKLCRICGIRGPGSACNCLRQQCISVRPHKRPFLQPRAMSCRWTLWRPKSAAAGAACGGCWGKSYAGSTRAGGRVATTCPRLLAQAEGVDVERDA